VLHSFVAVALLVVVCVAVRVSIARFVVCVSGVVVCCVAACLAALCVRKCENALLWRVLPYVL